MIPSYQEFMRPFLEIAHQADGKEVRLRDVINQLADKFCLSEAEREETLPSGRQTILDNRVGWARTYLTKAGLLETTRRAHFVITSRGISALQDHTVKIDNDYLKQFDEFVAFKQKTNESDTPSVDEESDKDITPDEALRAACKEINKALAQDIEYGLSYTNTAVSDLSPYRYSAELSHRPCTVKGLKDCLWPNKAMTELLNSMRSAGVFN